MSRVGLKTAMITWTWCTTSSTTRTTWGRILCKKNNNNKKKTSEKWQNLNKWQNWPFRKACIVRQNDEKSSIFGLQFKFPRKSKPSHRRKLIFLTLSYEKKVKLPFFNFSRRSSELVVRKLLLIQKWLPTIHHSHKKRKGSAVPLPWTSLIFICRWCSLPQKNRKSSKCITF